MSVFFAQLAIVLAALGLGARTGGIGLGVWGGVGLAVLTFGWGVAPGHPPVDVLFIILGVITAAASMEAAGGIDYLVRQAERLIRWQPRMITFVAPLVAYGFTFCAGTGHIVYPLLPVIAQVALEAGVRPERPLSVAAIAGHFGITCSPVSAATAAMIGFLAPSQIGLPTILAICVPSTLLGLLAAALVQSRAGRELDQDETYRARVRHGELEAAAPRGERPPLPRRAGASVAIFLAGIALIILLGLCPGLRPQASRPDGTLERLAMPDAIPIVMLGSGAAILAVCRPRIDRVPATRTMLAGMTALVSIYGIGWLGNTFLAAHRETVMGGLSQLIQAQPALFAVGLFAASVLLFSQAATVTALMPLGLSLGLPPATLVACFPAVNGLFFLPNYGIEIAAIHFDRTGTTGIGRYVLNHSFMKPGLVATVVSVATGFLLARTFV